MATAGKSDGEAPAASGQKSSQLRRFTLPTSHT